MPKVWSVIDGRRQSRTRPQAGFSIVEILLAMAVFSLLSVAVIGALVYGRASTANSGERLRANLIAEEGVEALRNIRDAGYANLTDGTYGLAQVGNTWTLSGASDSSDMYTRSVTVAPNGLNRKRVTSTVNWAGVQGTGATSVVSQLTNWQSALTKTWATPSLYAGLNLSGSVAGFKVATAGSYAYIVRNSSTGPNFAVINISTPTSPTVVGSLTLAGTPTNIAVSGNYAYVSNSSGTAELQIVSIATPTAPALSGTYNATGTAGGRGVYAVGSVVYLVRGANAGSDEFVVVNALNPGSPVRLSGYGLAVNMNEVYVNGTVAYIATSSNTQEILVINLQILGLLTLGTSVDLPGTTDATTIDGWGNYLIVGQGANFYTVGLALSLIPIVGGTVTMPGTVNDVAYDSVHNYAMVGTNFANGEFQVVNVSAPNSPVNLSSVNMTGSLNLTGVSYNATYDVAPGASSSTSMEAVVFGPN